MLRTREPGGAPGAERLRGLLLDRDAAWAPFAETLLHFAARAEHVERTIRPALAAGMWIVCDRFADSTMAYQGYGLGGDRAAITALTAMLGVRPDLTLVLDVPVATSVARLRGRGGQLDRYEKLGEDFFARIRQGFRAIAAADPDRCVLLDADGDEEAVAERIWGVVTEKFDLGPASSPSPLVGEGRGEGALPARMRAIRHVQGPVKLTPPPSPLPPGEGERQPARPLLRYAREMRRSPTPPERVLWRALRNEQLYGLKFRRQAMIGRYIIDFFCADARLVVEVDGITHVDAPRDAVRDAVLQASGLLILRFWNNEVMANLEGVLDVIQRAAQGRTPHPGSLPQGEREKA